jgi:hypothetical protein
MRRDQGCADALAFTHANLIHESWTFRSTDPRDKVFALHGILNSVPCLGNRWIADYTGRVDHGPEGNHPAPGLFGNLSRGSVGLIIGKKYESIR